MKRPALEKSLTAQEFESWYWTKDELLVFCRTLNVSTAGSKEALAARIAAFLGGAEVPAPAPRRVAGDMPDAFVTSTVIGPGWTCTTALREFFELYCGSRFKFNAAVREFIHTQSGRTLADAIECYHASINPDLATGSIAQQFEYNRHMKDYAEAHPGASQADAIEAWWMKRGRKRN